MLRQVLPVTLALVGSAGIFCSEPANAAGLTCPFTRAADAPKGAPPLSEFFTQATDVPISSRLGGLVAALRQSGMTPASIVDHLVGAYCPLVAANGSLSETQKTDIVRRFARHVAGLAYVPPGSDELEVLVDLPLVPQLLDQIDMMAKKAGISRDTWIERAINRQLAAP